TVCGVAERTVQRAMQALQGCGWLARLAGPPARERPHGRYTVVNLVWERPGGTGETRDTRKAAATTSPEEPVMASCHTLSPLQGAGGGNLSPVAAQASSITPAKTDDCADTIAALLQPFQEEGQEPEPTGRGLSGATTREGHDKAHPPTTLLLPSDDEPVTDDDYAAATAGLPAEGPDPGFLIRPVVLAEVPRVRDEVACGPAGAPGQALEVPAATQVTTAPAMCPATPRPSQAPSAPVVPACAR